MMEGVIYRKQCAIETSSIFGEGFCRRGADEHDVVAEVFEYVSIVFKEELLHNLICNRIAPTLFRTQSRDQRGFIAEIRIEDVFYVE